MQCVGCKYPHTEVVRTRHDDKESLTMRRRQCLRCGLRFTTHEKLQDKSKKDKSK